MAVNRSSPGGYEKCTHVAFAQIVGAEDGVGGDCVQMSNRLTGPATREPFGNIGRCQVRPREMGIDEKLELHNLARLMLFEVQPRCSLFVCLIDCGFFRDDKLASNKFIMTVVPEQGRHRGQDDEQQAREKWR